MMEFVIVAEIAIQVYGFALLQLTSNLICLTNPSVVCNVLPQSADSTDLQAHRQDQEHTPTLKHSFWRSLNKWLTLPGITAVTEHLISYIPLGTYVLSAC